MKNEKQTVICKEYHNLRGRGGRREGDMHRERDRSVRDEGKINDNYVLEGSILFLIFNMLSGFFHNHYFCIILT